MIPNSRSTRFAAYQPPSPCTPGRAGVYLCSASTPPGPGVHGLGGWYAAKRVLREVGIMAPPSLAP